ncbi:MAG TPA: 23S rRNA (uracil(1939)-C(5))-methyltransferase RlmD [Mariprofundaceae bacterium]|nr:23S rRNA (uracil(1939)-C(5))-methyltransferase RlmD [Mariprofundaceae bacterium]
MPETLNGTIQGMVEKVVHGGDGLIRHEGQTIFIPNTAAGDSITYQVTDKKRGVLRGKLVEVITPAKGRVSPPCPVALDCGGCALQAMHTQNQADLKTSWVVDAFQMFITETTKVIPIQPQTKKHAGRRRVRWFMDKGKLGFRQRFSHDIVHTETCIAITQNLDALRNTLETMNLPESIQSIQAVELSNGTHIILESEQDVATDFTPPVQAKQQWWWRKLNTPSIKALHKPIQSLFDQIQLPSKQNNQKIGIEIGANDFVQGHAAGNQSLVSQILAWSQSSQRIVDLFSGCGNLSLPLAATGKQVVGAELNPASIKAANNNAKRLQVDATYQVQDLFDSFSYEPFIGADTLILDPPRKGAKRICQNINKLFPKQIIMVNCDVAAGARDAKALADAGFKLKALRPLDLFPYTGHVEVLSLWQP